ncbi:transposase [Nonomuraea sp. NPDC001023]|uniref:transposase n=1 Tax=unclassified Nonomuraea TaxID=2593643 RepID=UPI00331FFBCD
MKTYSPEFKASGVAAYMADPSRTFTDVAKDLGVNRETLRLWVRAAQAQQGGGPGKDRRKATAPDIGGRDPQEENKQLRNRVRQLEHERDILRRTVKYFAAEASW